MRERPGNAILLNGLTETAHREIGVPRFPLTRVVPCDSTE
jgi:hypothetical protein